MLPIIVIVGRPNVGKSTLFNRLTCTSNALVANFPGLTRDRQYGCANIKGCEFIIIDTAGIRDNGKDIEKHSINQSLLAIKESDVVLFMVDAKDGLMPEDQKIANYLRTLNKSIFLVVNKTDGINQNIASLEFYALGLNKCYQIAASHGSGVITLMEVVLLPWIKTKENIAISKKLEINKNNKEKEKYFLLKKEDINQNNIPIKLAVIGRPNVGKSTLINRFLGENRMVVYDMPGTTRDSIYIPMKYHGRQYILIDTAGIRKRSRITSSIEKNSVIKTLQAIKDANVVILMLDALNGIVDQDLSLLSFILYNGRSLVILVNKWDDVSKENKIKIKESISYRLSSFDFVQVHFISALYEQCVDKIFKSILECYQHSTKSLNTGMLTRIMKLAVESHQPPLIHGHRIKLKYAHIGGHNPPIIIIHGNQVKKIPIIYKRFLINYFRRSLNIKGTPIYINFKESKNPYINRNHILKHTHQHKHNKFIIHKKNGK
ncbi:ribosome biogenesis GTPase Der [Pantoea sp. Mhis]|uniref:ribosome biogenesis GTPase Der n=1 Tax=Pantoea sp. Mhis TaxID=2576759 RepID=UPI00135A816E|nr:ribosome biogenesis GTPase Der [Pantoea sp. Mhis]MXP56594.1 ribosome biogenesis GTPase Der [Pantoea sp. Mhis]